MSGGGEFLLPRELYDAAGIPDDARYQIAYIELSAKYCALVEAAMKATGGEPIRVDLERVKEILGQEPGVTPSEEIPVVAERPVDGEHGLIDVSLATVEEVDAANERELGLRRRDALDRMGPHRN